VTRGRALVPAAVVAVMLVIVAGCGVPTQKGPTRLSDNEVRVVGPVPATTIPRGTPTDLYRLCFVSDNRIVTIVRELPAPLSARRALAGLVEGARAGLPTGLRSAITGAEITGTEEAVPALGIARVDLSADFAGISPAEQILALAQVVCTLTNVPAVEQVRFTLGGEPVDIPRADGSLTSEPVSRRDYRDLFAPV
jgi:spore germination protein GerM